MTIPKIIRTILEQEGISQTEMGRRLGLSKQAVNNLLSREDMRMSTVLHILHAIGYDFIIEKRRNNR